MIKIGDIISEELFLNSYHILDEYFSQQNDYIVDVNLRLIKPYFQNLNDRSVRQFYKSYIANELVFALPEFCSSEIVSVPKNMTGVREYRFMSTFSHILYNAFGLVFVECSLPLIESLDFQSRGVHSYFPTRYLHDGRTKEWKVINKYRQEYAKFSEKIEEVTSINSVVIKTDITGYFENIDHSKLIDLLFELSPLSSLRQHNIKDDAREVLEFYIDNLMQKKLGVPQGRKNFTSDFFGYFYLIIFDNEVRKLCSSKTLSFKASVRYVDDTFIVFDTSEKNKAKIHKELLKIEQKISSWLFDKLGLSMNANKTRRIIIENSTQRAKFIRDSNKSVSLGEKEAITLRSGRKVDFDGFKAALLKFKFTDDSSFLVDILQKDDRESLKFIFSNEFASHLKKKQRRDELLQVLESIDIELAVDEINILLPVFFNDKDDRFEKLLRKIVRANMSNLGDRRLVHIILVAMTKLKPATRSKQLIEKYGAITDSYAKYLPVAMGLEPSDINSAQRVFVRIKNETLKNSRAYRKHLLTDILYNHVIYQLAKNEALLSEALIQSLKMFQFEVAHKRWDSSFNYLQNIFHEIMKCKYQLKESATIQHIAANLSFLNPDQELLLRKFYDRRNFNPISHPSKKGLPAERVGEEEFVHYKDDVLLILSDCLAKWRPTQN